MIKKPKKTAEVTTQKHSKKEQEKKICNKCNQTCKIKEKIIEKNTTQTNRTLRCNIVGASQCLCPTTQHNSHFTVRSGHQAQPCFNCSCTKTGKRAPRGVLVTNKNVILKRFLICQCI